MLGDRGQVCIGQMMQTEGGFLSLRRRASDDEPGPGCHSPAVRPAMPNISRELQVM